MIRSSGQPGQKAQRGKYLYVNGEYHEMVPLMHVTAEIRDLDVGKDIERWMESDGQNSCLLLSN